MQKFNRLNTWIDDVYCMYEYNEAMKYFFRRYKFGKDILLAAVFRQSIYNTIKKLRRTTKKENIPIVPIPMHPHNIQMRTFSHVDELLEQANISYIHLLSKITTETQSSKNREQRLNTKKLFEINCQQHLTTVLLFDDIKTTGTTLLLAEQQLKEAGIKNVIKVVLAAVL